MISNNLEKRLGKLGISGRPKTFQVTAQLKSSSIGGKILGIWGDVLLLNFREELPIRTGVKNNSRC